MKKILIITSPREARWIDDAATPVSRGLRDFVAELNNNDEFNFSITTLDKIDVSIVDQHITMYDRYTQKDLSGYDLIHFRNIMLYQDYARAITHYMVYHDKKVFENIDTAIPEYGKLSQMVLFAIKGIPVPNTWAAWHVADLPSLLRTNDVKYPFILKANNGIKGHDNYLVRDENHFTQISRDNAGLQFVVQNFIPNNGDLRVLYFGINEQPLVFKRVAMVGSHLNNTSRGGVSEEILTDTVDIQARKLADQAAVAVNRQLAGVDVIQDSTTNKWYILEVNANPALSSGSLLDKKAVGYMKMIKELV